METKFTKGPCEVRSSEKAHEPGHFWHEITADGAVHAKCNAVLWQYDGE